MSTINWQHIYQDYSPKLLGICRRYIQDIYTAEDIVQDSFITAIQKNNQLNDEKALFAWLKKIVVNNALQHIRKYSKNTFVDTEPSEIPDTYAEMEHTFPEEKNIFIYDFTREELLSSIDNLPPHHKSVFNLFFIENHSHAEISGLLGITVNTSKSHLLRAKKSVQNYLLSNAINQNTPKKKLAQLFVIFGLGGLLWAQTFKSKFADFTISHSKKLEIPSGSTGKIQVIPSSNAALQKKGIIAGTVLIIIVISVLLLRPGNGFFTVHKSQSSAALFDKNHNVIEDPQLNKSISGSDSIQSLTNRQIKEVSSENDGQNNILKINDKEKVIGRQNFKKGITGDSLAEAPQKVMVVKKIIKRDTIFVEK
ncbi:sigma-70 family RNA polymerase sigma factor [uncultured Chryseobacterium sp.]|uniref:RNA polymerase sigma factor n=1 Tax=uncultured Chryseobacterium sp. TaxID=259322 RepID=UPI0025FC89CC|nr:sigma-70 family RNA polymerase sigma factor [uncultured Chryseobacterium sp.]